MHFVAGFGKTVLAYVHQTPSPCITQHDKKRKKYNQKVAVSRTVEAADMQY